MVESDPRRHTDPAERLDPTRIQSTRGAIALVVIGAVVQMASIVPIPFLVRRIFDDILGGESGDSALLFSGLALVALQLVSAGATVLIRSSVAVVGAENASRIRRWVHDMLLTRSLQSVRTHDDAELMQSMNNLPHRIEDAANTWFGQVLPSALTTMAIATVLFFLDWQLTLVLFVSFPLLVIVHRVARSAARAAFARHSESERLLMRQSLSMIERLESVRTTDAGGAEQSIFEKRNDQIRKAMIKVVRARAVVVTSNTTAVVMSVTVLLLVGGWSVAQDRLTIGQFLAFYAGVAILRGPAQSLGNAAPILDSGRDARRLLRELDASLVLLPAGGTTQVPLDESIVLRNVHFAYDDSPILDGVDLALERGQFTALVGPNGAGKTTLVLQLLGLLEPDDGQRLADGVPYADVDLPAMRNRIGVSFQQAALAEASVVDNITYGRSFTEDEIDEAIDLAGLESIIATLEDGRHTMVGPGGRRLSKGQEQRIALARAVVGRPQVLVLDEPTNHLDPYSVAAFLEKLVAQPQRPALLVVSHDHRALDLADQVIELRRGRVQTAPAR